MELSTGRLETFSRIEESCLGHSTQECRQRALRRQRQDRSPGLTQLQAEPADDEAATEEEPESHQLDDLA
jgi:hypothetical protein